MKDTKAAAVATLEQAIERHGLRLVIESVADYCARTCMIAIWSSRFDSTADQIATEERAVKQARMARRRQAQAAIRKQKGTQ